MHQIQVVKVVKMDFIENSLCTSTSIRTLQKSIKINSKYTEIMAHSSHARNNILMDLFNLPSLPDQRGYRMMICNFPKDFYIPDGKKLQDESNHQQVGL